MGRLGEAASGLRTWLATPVGARSGGAWPAGGRVRRWLVALRIRPVDVLATAAVIAAVELNVATATGPSQEPLDALTWTWGAVVALPVLVRHRWPRGVLIACSVLLLLFYSTYRRDISPVPLLCLPLYDAAAAGFLALAIIIPVFYMTIGLFVVDAAQHLGALTLTEEFLPSLVVLLLAILLGDAVRNRRALAAETAERLRLAEEEREREGARRVAEERLRIARELHDTVAHSMATIAVQAASALHVLDAPGGGTDPGAREALAVIRETSKGALADMRVTLNELRAQDGEVEQADTRTAGLARLDVLCDAVRAAGAPVTVTVEGEQAALPPAVDHSAYRILQESLTNVLRHAGPDARADVLLAYDPAALTITVTDDGGTSPAGTSPAGAGDGASGGHGLAGMAERVTALGGEFSAGARPGGGFQVIARLPLAPAPAPVADRPVVTPPPADGDLARAAARPGPREAP